jgi:hypothetical protein
MRHSKAAALVLLLSCVSFAQTPAIDPEKIMEVTPDQRAKLLNKAHLWTFADPERVLSDLDPAFPLKTPIGCDFVDPPKNAQGKPDIGDGASPKFSCLFLDPSAGDGHRTLKVKYHPTTSTGEARTEVAASLIARAIGLPTDAVRPIHVQCRNCPAEPWSYLRTGKLNGPLGTFNDPVASVEFPLKGRKIVDPTSEDGLEQGWSFPELDLKSSDQNAQVDALELFLTMIRHLDSKGMNQRLICADKGKSKSPTDCDHPIAFVADFGGTFGEFNGLTGLVSTFISKKDKVYDKGSLGSWMKHSVFKKTGEKGCEGDIESSRRATLKNPKISEQGRLFLLERLNKLYRGTLLSDQTLDSSLVIQIFERARMESTGEIIEDPVTRQQRVVTARDWAAAFTQKAIEIREASCNSKQAPSKKSAQANIPAAAATASSQKPNAPEAGSEKAPEQNSAVGF